MLNFSHILLLVLSTSVVTRYLTVLQENFKTLYILLSFWDPFFVMDKELADSGFKLTFNPVGDGDCFFSAASFQLSGVGIQYLKDGVFQHLEKRQFDVSTVFLVCFK